MLFISRNKSKSKSKSKSSPKRLFDWRFMKMTQTQTTPMNPKR